VEDLLEDARLSVHRSSTSIARALLVSAVLGPLASLVAQAVPVTIVDFTGPTALTAGSQGTFQLDVNSIGVGNTITIVTNVLDPVEHFLAEQIALVETVGLPIFTFVSGEGETLVQALSAPANGARSLSATFTFEDPGVDIVGVSGSVQTTDETTTTVFTPTRDANGAITGFNIRTTISTATRIDVVADQLQVAVSEAVSAAPEPGSLLLMSAGLLGFAILRQRKRIGV